MVTCALTLAVLAVWAFVFTDQGAGGAPTQAERPASSPAAPSSASSSSTSSGKSWTINHAQKALAVDGSRVLVLGDTTGDDLWEWVDIWGKDRGTPPARWQAEQKGYQNETPETRVWSGGAREADATYPVKHWDEIWPSAAPDLVLLSFGHGYDAPDKAVEDLADLRSRIESEVPGAPIVVVLQNPQEGEASAKVREEIADWAKKGGLPTIDVAAAFEGSGTPVEDLRRDGAQTSEQGAQLWADTVEQALTS